MMQHWTEIMPAAPSRLWWMVLIVAYLILWILSLAVQRRWAKRLLGASGRGPVAIWPWMLLKLVALSLIVVAATDLRSGSQWTPAQRPSLQLVFVLDRSRSMLAEDVAVSVSRMELGKSLIRQLVRSSTGTPIALVTFAGDVRVDVPLTRDHSLVEDALEKIDPNNNVFFGSNLGEAVARSMACFADRLPSEKRLIIISDGEMPSVASMPAFRRTADGSIPAHANLSPAVLALRGGAQETIDSAAHLIYMPDRVSVDVVVIGDAQTGGRIPVEGSTPYLIHEGQVVWTKAQLEPAQSLATAVGGTVIPIASMESFQWASRRIGQSVQKQLQQSRDGTRISSIRMAKPLYGWLVVAALGLLIAEEFVAAIKHRGRRSVGRPFSSAMLVLFSLAVLVGAGPNPPPSTSQPKTSLPYRQRVIHYNDAVGAYRDHDYETAERLFRQASRDRELGLRGRSTFNLANTIYRSVGRGSLSQQRAIERLSEAIELYRQCIQLGHRPEDADVNIRIMQALIQQIEQQPPDRSDPAPQPDSGQNDREPPEGQGDSEGDPQRTGERGDEPNDPSGAGSQQVDHGARPGPGTSGGQSPGALPHSRPLDQGQAQSLLNDIRERAADRESSNRHGPVPVNRGAESPVSLMPW